MAVTRETIEARLVAAGLPVTDSGDSCHPAERVASFWVRADVFGSSDDLLKFFGRVHDALDGLVGSAVSLACTQMPGCQTARVNEKLARHDAAAVGERFRLWLKNGARVEVIDKDGTYVQLASPRGSRWLAQPDLAELTVSVDYAWSIVHPDALLLHLAARRLAS